MLEININMKGKSIGHFLKLNIIAYLDNNCTLWFNTSPLK